MSDLKIYKFEDNEHGLDLQSTIYSILRMTRENETAPDWALGLKLSEEAGEVNTAVLKANGFLRHKELKEGVIEEVADVINVCLGLLSQHYTNENEGQILYDLNVALLRKSAKYAKVLKEGTNG